MNIERGKTKNTPGKWYLSFAGHPDAPNAGCVVLWCPACAEPMTLHKWRWLWPNFPGGPRVVEAENGHAIAADGTLDPSVDCPHCGCPYHESGVKLVGWNPADVS